MIRVAEAVLEGHPDKFADQIADRIIEEAYRYDPEAYGQIEVGVWSDRVWLSGGLVTRRPFTTDVRDLVVEVGQRIGYTAGNHIDVEQYRVDSHVCLQTADPRAWTHSVNDQCICIGWAGYDAKTRFLPPEQFVVHAFRQALVAACRGGALQKEGPDGKVLVRVKEHAAGWELEHILCTLQHRETSSILEVTDRVLAVLQAAYAQVQAGDSRWSRAWERIEVLVNPNGPLVEGGSDGDNGQTGRKLVMDYYGPRVAIGGGALSGKDLTHIDRVGAYAARQAAIEAVQSGAKWCTVQVAYAPNRDRPLDLCYEMEGRGQRRAVADFRHGRIRQVTSGFRSVGRLGGGTHFFDEALPWNGVGRLDSGEKY